MQALDRCVPAGFAAMDESLASLLSGGSVQSASVLLQCAARYEALPVSEQRTLAAVLLGGGEPDGDGDDAPAVEPGAAPLPRPCHLDLCGVALPVYGAEARGAAVPPPPAASLPAS